jgi:hypothetical protein
VNFFKQLWKVMFPPKMKRVRLNYCSYEEAARLLQFEKNWRVAPEEDTNPKIGMVYLEQVEPV